MYISKNENEIYLLLFFINYIIKGLIEEHSFKFMKYILPLLLLSAFLIPFSYTVHAQNQNNKVFQNITGLDKGNSNSTNQSANQSANQSIANDQNKTGQTEQDKAVKNVTQSTNQVAKQASEALNKIGNQVGQAFQNITGLNNEKNISNK